jgi:hypothetical protein
MSPSFEFEFRVRVEFEFGVTPSSFRKKTKKDGVTPSFPHHRSEKRRCDPSRPPISVVAFAQLAGTSTVVACFVAASRVRYHFASRATPQKRRSADALSGSDAAD